VFKTFLSYASALWLAVPENDSECSLEVDLWCAWLAQVDAAPCKLNGSLYEIGRKRGVWEPYNSQRMVKIVPSSLGKTECLAGRDCCSPQKVGGARKSKKAQHPGVILSKSAFWGWSKTMIILW
jgi:hypothetical protein